MACKPRSIQPTFALNEWEQQSASLSRACMNSINLNPMMNSWNNSMHRISLTVNVNRKRRRRRSRRRKRKYAPNMGSETRETVRAYQEGLWWINYGKLFKHAFELSRYEGLRHICYNSEFLFFIEILRYQLR